MEDNKTMINIREEGTLKSALQKFDQADTAVDPGVNEPPAASSEGDAGELRALGLLRGLCLILKDHNAPETVFDSIRNQLFPYLAECDEGTFVKRAKYVTVWPMAKYLKGCAPPKKPDVVWVPTGQFRNWARCRFRDFTRKNTTLWYSWLQGKRSCLPLSEEMVRTAYEEHRVAMEGKDPIDTPTKEGVMQELEPFFADYVVPRIMAAYVPSTLEEHLEYYGSLEGDSVHVASIRACYESSREKGGQLGSLVQLCFPSSGPPSEWDLDAMSYQTVAFVNGTVRYNVLTELHRSRTGETQWRDALHGEALFYRGQRRLKATIQVVLEPLKTRVISKGEAVPYYLSKPLQIVLHDILRAEPAFRLIGRPLDASDLVDLSDNRVSMGHGRFEWFSIDYSAATDGLSASLSAAIMNRMLRSQRSDLLDIWMSVLAPHRCRYPFPHDKDVLPVDQVNGQLMGSILSFPILCLANLGLYLYTIRKDPRSLRDKLNGVLVNGDDMLYVARRSVWDDHVANGERVGLKMSPGKAYHHEVYANANSACFHSKLSQASTAVDWTELDPEFITSNVSYGKSGTPTRVPFLNTGLYFGQNKVMNKVSETGSEVTSRVTVIGELLKGCRTKRSGKLTYRGYLHRHGAEIAQECAGRNIFFSRALGGMGVEYPEWLTIKSTRAQRQEAFRRYHANPNAWLGFGPLPGPEVSDTPTEVRAPWLVPGQLTPQNLKLKERRLDPELNTATCLLPFRTCSVPRRTYRDVWRTETVDFGDLDGEALECRPYRVQVRNRIPLKPSRPRLSYHQRTARENFMDSLTFDEQSEWSVETNTYHGYLDWREFHSTAERAPSPLVIWEGMLVGTRPC
jgi:hypothetical protein